MRSIKNYKMLKVSNDFYKYVKERQNKSFFENWIKFGKKKAKKPNTQTITQEIYREVMK